MDPDVRAFAQVMMVLVPSIVVVVATVVVGFRALRRAPATQLPQSPADDRRLERLEQSVDAIALEMERVGESQRFLTKLMAERIPAGGDSTDGRPERARVITPH